MMIESGVIALPMLLPLFPGRMIEESKGINIHWWTNGARCCPSGQRRGVLSIRTKERGVVHQDKGEAKMKQISMPGQVYCP